MERAPNCEFNSGTNAINEGLQFVSNSGTIQQYQQYEIHNKNTYNSVTYNSTTVYKNANNDRDLDANLRRHMELHDGRVHQTNVSNNSSSFGPGPCDWILERDFYMKWDADDAKTSVLWIQGQVGWGKSTVMSRIVDDLDERSVRGKLQLLYFYLSAINEKLRGQGALIRSFMAQIMKRDPSMDQFPGSSLGLEELKNQKLNDLELKSYLFNYLRNMTGGPVYIIVDALDEINYADLNLLLEMLIEESELSPQNRSCFKILLSSRDDVGIQIIQSLPSVKNGRTKLQHFKIQATDTANDIESFIRRELTSICRSGSSIQDLEWRNHVVETLTKYANGTFLWVHYQMEAIRNLARKSTSLIDDHIKTLAIAGEGSLDGIDRFYEQVMDRFAADSCPKIERKTVRKVFALLIYSPGPIPVPTLLDALDKDIKKDDPTDIAITCKHLVTVDEGLEFFRWTHYSVYEYLKTAKIKEGKVSPPPHHIVAFEGATDEAIVADICLSYLCRDRFTSLKRKYIHCSRYGDSRLKELISENTFLEFACTQWAYHSRLSIAQRPNELTTTDKNIENSLITLCEQKNQLVIQLAFQVFLISRSAYVVDSVHLTHILSHFHLFHFFEKLNVISLSEVDIQAGNGFTSLHWAIDSSNSSLSDGKPSALGSRTIVDHEEGILQTLEKLITIYKADINIQDSEGRTPLYHAAQQGYLRVVERLLSVTGILINRKSKSLGTPLIVASYKGHAEVVDMLIKKKADLKSKGELGTALHVAASRGCKECVSIILKHKGDNAKSLDISLLGVGTPLHQAAYYGHPEIVEKLLEKKFRVNVISPHYGSPLQAAANACYKGDYRAEPYFEKVFDILLKNKADVNARGGLFQTALNAVVHNGHLRLADMLLKNGADANIRGPSGSTALQIAQEEGYTDIVALLNTSTPPDVATTKETRKPFRTRGKSRNPRAQKEELKQGSLVESFISVPLWMFMNALKADDENRMEIFITAYMSIVKRNIKANQIGSLEMLAKTGERVFKDILIFTVRKYNSQDSKLDPQRLDTKKNRTLSRKLAQLIIDFFTRIFNKERETRQIKHILATDASRPEIVAAQPNTKDFPFYSQDPAFKALNRLTSIAVSILGDAINCNNEKAVNLLSTTWTRALLEVDCKEEIGYEMLKDLVDSRAKELMLAVQKGEKEQAKSIVKVAIELLATAIEGGEDYKHLLCNLARIWALAMGDIYILGETEFKRQDYLGTLLQTFIEAIRKTLDDNDGKGFERLAEVILAIFVHLIAEPSLGQVFDKVAKILLEIWDEIKAVQGELVRQAFGGGMETLIELLRSAVNLGRRNIFELAKEQQSGIVDKLEVIFAKYVNGELISILQ
ncbi:hypothetical protein TWF506_009367 [Arthrobotrys conoides]|uniref:NACHT domain-containing protein n=1 Tax=Arthrobotrys conoides TaxID=74498 RepID=A0AAN8PEQ4_9PEZI